MSRGRSGQRTSYAACTQDLRQWARSRLHVLSRASTKRARRLSSRGYCVACVNCGKRFEADYSSRGWRPVVRLGEDFEAYCPKAVFGFGEGI